MAALDLLGRRWALRILWELGDEPLGVRELRRRCDDASPDVLYRRLRELQDAGLLAQDTQLRYGCTPLGASLAEAIAPLDRWANTWARKTAPIR
jgi:DNA-binding HxlR family transcriptional regulator